MYVMLHRRVEVIRLAKIVSVREYTDIDEQGNFVRMYEITYEIEGVGTFTTNMPKSEFSALAVRQKIQAEEAEIRRLLGS